MTRLGGLPSPRRKLSFFHGGAFAAGAEDTCMDPKASQPPLLVTLGEAAALLSVSLRTVQRMAADGRIEVVRPAPDAPRVRYADLVELARRGAGGDVRPGRGPV